MIESPEINTSGQLIYDKEGKTTQWEEIPFNKWCWGNWTAIYLEKNEIRTYSNTIHKNKLKTD